MKMAQTLGNHPKERIQVLHILSVCVCVCVCVCRLSYPVCKARASYYYRLSPLPYFSTLSHKRYDFRGKKIIEHKTCVWFSLQHFLEIVLILRRTGGNMMKNVYLFLRKVPIIFVKF